MGMSIFLVCLLCGSIISGAAGVGGNLVVASAATMLLPAGMVLPVCALVQTPSCLLRMSCGMRHLQWRILASFAAGAVPACALACWCNLQLSCEGLTAGLGIFILGCLWLPGCPERKRLPGSYAAAGAAQTALAVTFGAGGPIGAAMLARDCVQREAFVATLAAMGFLLHLGQACVCLFRGADLQDLPAAAAAGAALSVFGTWFGTVLGRKLSQRLFNVVLRGILTLLAVQLIMRGFAWRC